MVHLNDDAMNKIPLKSSSGLDDEEKNGGEFIPDTATAEEARREQMRVNLLKWMKKLTLLLICFIGIALICYVIINLCFSDESNKDNNNSTSHTADGAKGNNHNSSSFNNGTIIIPPPLPTSMPSNTDADAIGTTTAFTDFANTRTPASVLVAASTAKLTEKPQMEEQAQQKELHMIQDAPITDENFQSKLGVYKRAVVCSDKLVCSKIGSNILSQGGSAVDSAIATLLCNGLATFQSMGIGGGMIMNVFIKDKNRAFTIDAREVAPFAATEHMFDNNYNASLSGPLAIAVPGELMGYQKAHEMFGKLPWQKLVEPSIKLCNEGFYITKHMRSSYKVTRTKNKLLKSIFENNATGEIHPVGTKIKPPKELCDTYLLLAKNGPMDFYNGTLAKLVSEDLKDLGSQITDYDLEAYVVDVTNSITMPLGDDILHASPPVSSGVVVANVLSVLEGYNFTKADFEGAENQANTIHRFAEALKFAFAKRWELGDERFNDVRELVSKLTNPEYGNEIRQKINDSSVLDSIYDYGAQNMGVDDEGTSHTLVLAPNGDAVSITSSINQYFGALQIGNRTGVIFNSGMNDFSLQGQKNYFGLPPSPSNFIEARKRPMSSMSPLILTTQNGDVRLLIGAAGGSRIISSVAEVAMRVLWLGQNIKEAIDAPRAHHQLIPNELEYETRLKDSLFNEKLLTLLRSKGHVVKPLNYPATTVSGIFRNSTAIYVNADFRKQGDSAGF